MCSGVPRRRFEVERGRHQASVQKAIKAITVCYKPHWCQVGQVFAESVRCAIINIPQLSLSHIPDSIDYTVHFTGNFMEHALHSSNNSFNQYQ